MEQDGGTTVNRDAPDINSARVTERIEATALKLLEEHPEGLRWADLNLSLIHISEPTRLQ